METSRSGTKGRTSSAPMRGWMPRCSRMSTRAKTAAASASAASSTARGRPRKVNTERLWSGSAWHSASGAPGTARTVWAIASMARGSRPSLTFGTHSKRGSVTGSYHPRERSGYPTQAMAFLPVGKPPAELLQRLFAKHVPADPRVIVGPQVGEDAAVLDMGDRYLVATTDPITFATDEMGWYALHVNANHLAVRGATPRWFLCTVLLPEGKTRQADVEQLFAEVALACQSVGVSLVGGHTDVTAGLPRTIVSGTMLG